MTDNATSARDVGQPHIPCLASILDVRAEAQFLAGHAPEAVNIPLEEISRRMYELPPKGEAVAVFDAEASRVARAADLLRQRGYRPHDAALSAEALTQRGRGAAVLWRPSPFLLEVLERMEELGRVAGCALDVACGAGREAVWLALCGWQVDAADVLPEALEMAEALARRGGVAIHTMRQDLMRRPALPARRYGLVTVFRFWHRPAAAAAAGAVAAGGFLAYETFHQSDARVGGTGKAVGDGELAGVFGDFVPVVSRDGIRRGDRVFSQFLGRARR